MPTIVREDGYRFYFYSREPNEPAHVRVDKDGGSAKVWLSSVTVATNVGCRQPSLARRCVGSACIASD